MSVEEQEKLQEQFIDYQLLSNDNIPNMSGMMQL
jgi:hypothetical protein